MIFNIEGHIEQIVKGTKTQTRRDSDKYEVGKTYAVQLGRGKPGDTRGRILITHKWIETKPYIHPIDAEAEGGYTVEEYEELYFKLHPNWEKRYCYEFEFWPTEAWHSLKQSIEDAMITPSIPYHSIRPKANFRSNTENSINPENQEEV